jgi:hypothetical protein
MIAPSKTCGLLLRLMSLRSSDEHADLTRKSHKTLTECASHLGGAAMPLLEVNRNRIDKAAMTNPKELDVIGHWLFS